MTPGVTLDEVFLYEYNEAVRWEIEGTKRQSCVLGVGLTNDVMTRF